MHTIDTRKPEQKFIDSLQRRVPRCNVRRVNEDEHWLYYAIDTARKRGYVASARKTEIEDDPDGYARGELRNYRLP
jgi:hypothetical protein